MSQQDDPIRRYPDGSIDFAYYMQRGRKLRSEQAHRLMRRKPAPAHRRSLWNVLAVYPRFAS